jgi:hypothetical protein
MEPERPVDDIVDVLADAATGTTSRSTAADRRDLGAVPAGAGRAPMDRRQNGVMGRIRFKAQLQPRGPAAAVVLDAAQVEAVGEGAKRFPVVATVNGYTWRTSVTRMGGEFLLGLNRDARDGAGVQAGDIVDVVLELDSGPREVVVPEALAAALADDPKARVAFEGMSFTHRKEYARWISEAKREETRQRRVRQALEMLRAGRTHS